MVEVHLIRFSLIYNAKIAYIFWTKVENSGHSEVHSARASNIFNDNGPSKKVKNVIFPLVSEGLVLGENDRLHLNSFNIGV